MAAANTNGGKTTGKKLTSDQAKLAKVVQRIGAIDKKPARATSKGKDLKDLKPLPRKNGAETVKSAAKNVPAIKKALAAKKPSAMGQSAKSHQKDLAKISGATAGTKKFAADKAKGLKEKENKPSPSFAAQKKAEKNTLKSFGKSK